MNLRETRRLLAYAHRNQGYGNTVTDDGGMDGFHPMSYHLRETENVTIRFGFRKQYSIRRADWMHDVMEDQGWTTEGLLALGFTPYEVALAWACTDGEGDTRHAKKQEAYRKINLTPDAIIVKLSDRIANVEHATKVGYTRKYNLYLHEQVDLESICREAPLSNPEFRPQVEAMWAHLNWLFSEEGRTALWGKQTCCPQPDEAAA